jgi:hypothetical protein
MIKGWSFAKIITLPVPDENLSDFPVEIPIVSDADIGGECLASGYDLRFTAADGVTELPYERESFAVAGGEATGIFWVKTSVATAGTSVWIYYGNSAAADGEDAEAVWDTNFKAVYHMKDATASTVLDSTANDNDGAKTAANEPIEAAGKIGKGQDFIIDDKIDLGSDASLDTYRTMGAWFNADSWDTTTTDHANPIVEHYDWGTHSGWVLGGRRGGQFGALLMSRTLQPLDGDRYAAILATDISTGAWHQAVGVVDGNTLRFYLDGTQVASVDITGWSLADVSALNASVGNLGVANPGYSDFDGKIDEVRISSVARTAAWIAYEYANMNPSDGGLTWGAEKNVKSAVRSFFES